MFKRGLLMILMLAMGATGAAVARSRVLLAQDEARIEVIVDGEANNDTVVLLPSSQRGSDDLDAVAGHIAAAGFKVLRPQPRGIGRSNGSLDNLTLHVLAADVAATIRALGGGRAVVVGHAYGHYVARVVDLGRPRATRMEVQEALGDKASVVVIAHASHARLPR